MNCMGNNYVVGTQMSLRGQNFTEEQQEEIRLIELERRDRERYVKDITTLMEEWVDFPKFFEYMDEQIKQARNMTVEERITRYENFGFTKEDYEESERIEGDFFMLWHAPELAKQQGMKPQEFLAKLFLASIGGHLAFPHGEVLKG